MEDFHYVHMARKVVGVGSVGTRAWIPLMLGRDDDQDPLSCRRKKPRNRCWKGSSNGRLQVKPPRSTGS
jgi:hypothetical protein